MKNVLYPSSVEETDTGQNFLGPWQASETLNYFLLQN